ncbi:MAG TPA: Gfo/Idh/MocA family oxidoreductase [Anaerohalosphaeraceae bacterium]|jgi:predicted dehydrogenase|nr:Gfo/Idh/MocA family oxidoreductase [Anaerohalosphaeraceae bacterium]HRT50014.1 Gfo/Idh/MocA family oxidoreductase [Anaerohalosphaeraceae bacterium]HRT85817.1 Gfo/Idh/MocA family oxidoreductase [Anaerohalosphaeraceae bacterium]
MRTTGTRRQFMKAAGAAFAARLILPGLNLAQSANSKLNHAAIGVGGMGWSDLNSIASHPGVQIAAICDVDENNLRRAAEKWPQARTYRDWRELFAKEGDAIDSVNVTTPDHMHAPIAMTAIARGNHVYCQKPLTHEVYEARQLTLAARRKKVVTQMGIQIHADVTYRMAVILIRQGAIGKVKEWHSWQGGTPWPRGGRPEGADPVPATLMWDEWLGVAPQRPFKADVYHPAKWRGWQDFGTGVLGDFACHIFDPVFTAIMPGPVLKVSAETAELNTETWPAWNIVRFEMKGSKYTERATINAAWYDGRQPPIELAQMPDGYKLPGSGSIIIGTEGVMVLPHWAGPQLYPLEKFKGYQRPKDLGHVDHYHQWVDACLGKGRADADFDYAGPLTEAVLLATIAVRTPGELRWDADALRFTNSTAADRLIRRRYRKGWEVAGL